MFKIIPVSREFFREVAVHVVPPDDPLDVGGIPVPPRAGQVHGTKRSARSLAKASSGSTFAGEHTC